MHSSIVADRQQLRQASSRLRAAVETALVFLVFFVQGAHAVPDVNEAHYLSKARHYWDASWCADDFFCNTADAHQAFYWTFGWLTVWMSLGATAWCGRLLTWTLLAWAWRRLSWSLVPRPYYAVLSAALLITLVSRGHMAGEWLIGGVEAKGFAYVLVMLGLEALVRGRWGLCVLMFGAASAFHVVIGGWSIVAAGVVWLASADRPPLSRLVLPLAGGLLLTLPGLLPALALTRGVDPQLVQEANRIYVYERLYHHLLPQQFGTWFVVDGWAVSIIARHLILIGVLVALVLVAGRADDRLRRLRGFVAASVGIAAVGMTIALFVPVAHDFAAGLLRFYWFRMSDVMVPVGVALVGCWLLSQWQSSHSVRHAVGLATCLVLVAVHLGQTMWARHGHPWPPADARVANLPAWRETCQWAQDHTPRDAVFLTPRLAQTFRWYASRAEVASRKDIPQDAAGIVHWWQRNLDLYAATDGTRAPRWRRSLAELGSRRLKALGRRYGADYIVTTADPPLALPRVGPRNPSYAIYQFSGDAGVGRPAVPQTLDDDP